MRNDRRSADILASTFSPDDLASSEQRWFHQFWCGYIQEHGCPPGRKDIDPLTMPRPLLPVLMLLDVERSGDSMRFHYRLTGTVAAQFYERDPTGRYFEDVYSGEYLDYVTRCFVRIVETHLPDYREMLLPWRRGQALHYSRTAYPLANDGWSVDMVALVFHPVYHRPPTSYALD